jgi:uncharacterized protein
MRSLRDEQILGEGDGKRWPSFVSFTLDCTRKTTFYTGGDFLIYNPSLMSEWNASSAKLDVWRFSREGGFLEGQVPLAALPRLADLLAGNAGTVTFRLEGAQGERGQARLRLVVSGTLSLVCQRCLAPLSEILAIDSLLELVAADSEPSQEELEDDSLDFLPVPLGGKMVLVDLIEDEILLALPVVPRHSDCSPPASAAGKMPPHPFAALSLLKRR